MRNARLVLATLVTLGIGLQSTATAGPSYSSELDSYTLGRAKAELEQLATAEGLGNESAAIELLLRLDVFATSNDTGCPGVDVDIINATSRTVWNVEVVIEQKDGLVKTRSDKLHLPYMTANTKARVNVSCISDYTYGSRYSGGSSPISLSYSAKGSKNLDEALPLMLEQNKDYTSGLSLSPSVEAGDTNLLEAALAMNDQDVAKELVQAIARTGVGRKELGEAIADNGTGAIADEVVTSMSKLPAAQQAQLARTLLASEVAERWKDKLSPMIDRQLCTGKRDEVIGLWIQAQGETGIPVEVFRTRIREKCKPTKADGQGLMYALDKQLDRAGEVLDEVDADLFASTVASWKAAKALPVSQLAFLKSTQSVERFDQVTAALKPDWISNAVDQVTGAPEGPAAARKAAWIGEAIKQVDKDELDDVVQFATQQLVGGKVPAASMRDAVKALAPLAPAVAEEVITNEAAKQSAIFEASKLKDAGIDMGEFLAFNAGLGNCVETVNALEICAQKIAVYKDRSGAGVLVKLGRSAVKPAFVTEMTRIVKEVRHPDGLVAIATALKTAGFDVGFVAEGACREAEDAVRYGGDPDSHIELAKRIEPNAPCISGAEDAATAKARKTLKFSILAIAGLIVPLPVGGWLMKRRWKKVQKELPKDDAGADTGGAKLDDRLGAQGLGRALRDGIAEAKRELGATPAGRGIASVSEQVIEAAQSTVARAVKSGDATSLIIRRGADAIYIVALPVKSPRPQVVQRYLGAPWPEHIAQIQRAAAMPVTSLVILCGPEVSEASLLVGFTDGTTSSDPDVLLDAKEAKERGANRFRFVTTISTPTPTSAADAGAKAA